MCSLSCIISIFATPTALKFLNKTHKFLRALTPAPLHSLILCHSHVCSIHVECLSSFPSQVGTLTALLLPWEHTPQALPSSNHDSHFSLKLLFLKKIWLSCFCYLLYTTNYLPNLILTMNVSFLIKVDFKNQKRRNLSILLTTFSLVPHTLPGMW